MHQRSSPKHTVGMRSGKRQPTRHTTRRASTRPSSRVVQAVRPNFRSLSTTTVKTEAVSPDTVSSTTPTSSVRPKTAIVMLNMGGPANPQDTFPFLKNLFSDNMIINLKSMQWLGEHIAKRRTPKVQQQYESIGGSPIGRWTDIQGKALTTALDKLSPESAPHKHYVAFRYAEPTTVTALEQMKADGITNAIAFSQYPQYSCTTTGSSIVDLWDKVQDHGLEKTISWSVIDRWHNNPTLHRAIASNIRSAIETIPQEKLQSTVILFSAHSVPVKIMEKGDQYPAEISSTVEQTMKVLNTMLHDKKNATPEPTVSTNVQTIPHLLCWQSKVGYLPWLGPSTAKTLENLTTKGFDTAIIVPIAFTSDHIETLFEIDQEYRELAHQHGVNLVRAPSLNDSKLLTDAQAEIVAEHIKSNRIFESQQYRVHCTECVRPDRCRTVIGYTPEQLFENKRH